MGRGTRAWMMYLMVSLMVWLFYVAFHVCQYIVVLVWSEAYAYSSVVPNMISIIMHPPGIQLDPFPTSGVGRMARPVGKRWNGSTFASQSWRNSTARWARVRYVRRLSILCARWPVQGSINREVIILCLRVRETLRARTGKRSPCMCVVINRSILSCYRLGVKPDSHSWGDSFGYRWWC